MTNIIKYLGDDDGHGHELNLIQQDDGTVVLLSRNPDTNELQRVVMLENQWRLLIHALFRVYGKEKCCCYRSDGLCGTVPINIRI